MDIIILVGGILAVTLWAFLEHLTPGEDIEPDETVIAEGELEDGTTFEIWTD